MPTATSTPTPIGGDVTAAVGEQFLISFELDPTSDFRWQLGELPTGSLLEFVDEIYIASPTNTGAWQHFTFRGLVDGQATLNFWLTHSGADHPVDRAQFRIVIGTGTPPCSAVYTLAVGERFEIVLESNSSTGYRWELSEPPTPGVVSLVSEQYIPPTSAVEGSPGWQRFVFEGAADGETDLNFWYIRPFDDPPAPANQLNFQALVGTGIPGCSGIYTIDQGEDFEVVLESNPSTGYRWELSEAPRPGIVSLVKEEFIASTSSAVGAAGSQIFTFQGDEAGQTPLKFWYVRPFDNPPVPTNEISFMVIVG